MTTSILMTHTQSLNGFDLQVLRDYAVEAPWEWRIAFEQLLELATAGQEAESHLNDIDDLKDDANEARVHVKHCNASVQRFVEEIETLARANQLTKGDVDTLCSDIREAMNILTEAVGKPE